MGLDMFVVTSKTPIETKSDNEVPVDAEKIFTWRKHYSLHQRMCTLHMDFGDPNLDFSISHVKLDESSLARLKRDILQGVVTYDTHGNSKKNDVRFIIRAMHEIGMGHHLYYYGWY